MLALNCVRVKGHPDNEVLFLAVCVAACWVIKCCLHSAGLQLLYQAEYLNKRPSFRSSGVMY